jgi:hypothetical protein
MSILVRSFPPLKYYFPGDGFQKIELQWLADLYFCSNCDRLLNYIVLYRTTSVDLATHFVLNDSIYNGMPMIVMFIFIGDRHWKSRSVAVTIYASTYFDIFHGQR